MIEMCIRDRLESIKMQRYGLMPLELMNIEELKGEETFLNNLSNVYKNNLSKNLTCLLYTSGFDSPSHCASTCKRMFGISLRDVHKKFKQIASK